VGDGRIRAAIDATAAIIVAHDAELAVDAAVLRRATRHRGLSLGDRACLALARRLEVPAYTADRSWGDLDVGLDNRVVR
jgi:ribonuclease VapC